MDFPPQIKAALALYKPVGSEHEEISKLLSLPEKDRCDIKAIANCFKTSSFSKPVSFNTERYDSILLAVLKVVFEDDSISRSDFNYLSLIYSQLIAHPSPARMWKNARYFLKEEFRSLSRDTESHRAFVELLSNEVNAPIILDILDLVRELGGKGISGLVFYSTVIRSQRQNSHWRSRLSRNS